MVKKPTTARTASHIWGGAIIFALSGTVLAALIAVIQKDRSAVYYALVMLAVTALLNWLGQRTLAWGAVAAALVIGLIWKEQIALLYVLATLSVTALLIVVAFANLGEAKRMTQAPPFDDSAAAGDAMNTAARR